MSVLEYDYAGLSDGDPLVQGVHHTLVTGAPVIREDGGYKYVEFNAVDVAAWFDQAFPATNAVSVAFEVDLIGAPEGLMELMTLRSASKQGNLLTSVTRAITLRNAADGNVSAGPALATGKYVIQVGAKVGATTSDGHYLYRIIRSSDDAELHAFTSKTQNTGTANFTSIRLGDFATTTDFHWRVGRLRIATGADALDGSGDLVAIDPYAVAPAAPALYRATGPDSSEPVEVWMATGPSTSVRVDTA